MFATAIALVIAVHATPLTAPGSAQDTLPTSPADAAAPPADTSAAADAYVDPLARRLVAGARARRRANVAIRRYTTEARDRLTIGVRVGSIERALHRRETAARVDWRRSAPARIRVLGARTATPLVDARVYVPDDLHSYAQRLAFDPADDRLLIGWNDSSSVRHPLAAGSEAHYRYASGEGAVVRLEDGGEVRLRELRVLPRRTEPQLIRGSFWLDEASHAVVRATFRPADAFEIARTGLGGAPALLGTIRLRVRHFSVEYGLWQQRWWLPRLMVFEGAADVGGLASVPARYTRRYGEYVVQSDDGGAAAGAPAASAAAERRARWGIEPRPGPPGTIIEIATDTTDPSGAGVLHGSLYDATALLSAAEADGLGTRVDDLPGVPWTLGRPTIGLPFGAPGLVRYNRVEGLSLGTRLHLDLGRLAADGLFRIGTADRRPGARLGLTRETADGRQTLAVYRRLRAADEANRPFSAAASLAAALAGRDEAMYYRTVGIELRSSGLPPGGLDYEWTVYAQRERDAAKHTDLSVRRTLDPGWRFPANPAADAAVQYGVRARLHRSKGFDPAGFRWTAVPAAEAATGTFTYLKPSLVVRATVPLPGRLVAAIEAAGGASIGRLGAQHAWRIGGPGTLRGYPPGTLDGPAFWRTRLELATERPAVRLVAFSDAGWAGRLGTSAAPRPRLSAGVGASLLDGILRVDLARPLVGSNRYWRAMVYLDGAI